MYADNTIGQILEGVKKIAHPDVQAVLRGSRDLLDETFNQWNGSVGPAASSDKNTSKSSISLLTSL
jgi:hypothetical protein